jgi:ketosteroid isomerase-like protein
MAQAELEKGAECLSLAFLLNRGDLGGASAWIARDACLLTPDATAVHGREGVRTVLAQLIAGEPRIELECRRLLVARDTAVSRERWIVTSNGAGSARATGLLLPTLCLQRIEGAWKLTVLVLWGWGSSLER